MIISYIILWKDKNESKRLIDYVSKRIRDLFDARDEDNYTIIVQNNELGTEIVCKLTEVANNQVDLKIECCTSEMKAARTIEEFSGIIAKSEYRHKIYVVTTYDEASNVFCKKAYMYLASFERKLRQLVYITVLKAFGVDWLEETYHDQYDKAFKQQHVENALEELSLKELENYLFKPYPDTAPEVIINELTSRLNKQDMSRRDILKRLEGAKVISLWERLFSSTVEMDDFQQAMSRISDMRNKVMHCRKFRSEELEKLRDVTRGINAQLDIAIEATTAMVRDEEYMKDTVNALRNLIILLGDEKLQNSIKRMMENLIKMLPSYLSELSKVSKAINETGAHSKD